MALAWTWILSARAITGISRRSPGRPSAPRSPVGFFADYPSGMTIDRIAPRGAANALRFPLRRSPAAMMLAGVLAITGLRLLWLVFQPADLYPDEAQYWFWAQHPALGYYSKPPLIAWLIALTTGLFGESELAIRLSAPLLHAGTAVFVYAVGSRLYDSRVGLWSALAYASLPGASISAFIISTDAPLLLCWAAALYAFIRAREDGGWAWWLALGVACGLGLLAKYAMAYWIFSALGFVLAFRAERRHFGRLLAAIGIALLLYSPNFWWNWSHGFVSYVHVRDNAGDGRAANPPRGVSRILRLAIRGVRPIVLCRADMASGIAAYPRRATRPPARHLCIADLGDDAGRQFLVARQCQLGRARLCVSHGAGRCLGAAAEAGASLSSSRSLSIWPPSPCCSPAAMRSPPLVSCYRRNTTRSAGYAAGALSARRSARRSPHIPDLRCSPTIARRSPH